MLAPAVCAKAYQCWTTAELMKNDHADVGSCESKTQTALTQQVASIESSMSGAARGVAGWNRAWAGRRTLAAPAKKIA